MRPLKTITLVEILKLIKKYLRVGVTRATIYQWQRTKRFPTNTGLGRPRQWREDQVLKWIEQQIKISESPPRTK